MELNVYLQMMQQFPSAVLEASRDAASTVSTAPSGISTPALDLSTLQTQLTTLAFRPSHIASCLSAVSSATARLKSSSSSSTNDPLVLSLSILSPLEAAIEWLLLHVPEDDLPGRYRPSSSSADFITGASAKAGGKDALVKGWLTDKLVKQAGFPRKAVEKVLETEERESVALDILGRRLCGWESGEDGWGAEEYGDGWTGDGKEREERQQHREEEILALQAVLGERYEETSAISFTIHIGQETTGGNDTLALHIIFDEASPYPSASYPTCAPAFYLTSDTLPAYIRLHLHSQLLRQFRDPERHDLRSVLESGWGGAVLSMVEYLETTLAKVVENPPDVGEVTKYLVPKVEEVIPRAEKDMQQKKRQRSQKERGEKRAPTKEDEERVKRKRQEMLDHPEYEKMMSDRMSLPAWKEKDNITGALKDNRVLVVVGEVSYLT